MIINELGVHAGVWVGDWADDSARYAIESSARIGYDFIEIPAVDPSAVDVGHTVRLLETAGIGAVVSLALSARTDINTEDPAVSARGEALLATAVDFARGIGADYVGGVTYSAMVKYAHAASVASRENSLAVLRRIAAKAADFGITIGIEYVNRYESNLLNTAAQTVRFIRDLGSPNVVLHLDTFHANSEELNLPSAVRRRRRAPRLHPRQREPPRKTRHGGARLPRTVPPARGVRVHGADHLRVILRRRTPRDTANTIGIWRDLWTDPASIASDALAFLRGHLAGAARVGAAH